MSKDIKGQPPETVQGNLQSAQQAAPGHQYSSGEQVLISAPAAAQRPSALEIMKSQRRWLFWREEPNPNPERKPLKIPYYPNGTRRSGTLDTDSDLQQLVSFEDACRIFSQGGYTGLAFALGPDGSGHYWQGVDVDDVSKTQLAYLVEHAPGYVEVTPSGDGYHVIGYGRQFETMGPNGTGVEAYSHGRFFTVTGNCFQDSGLACIGDYVETAIAPVHKAKRSDATSTSSATSVHVEPRVITELRSALASMRSDEYKLWTDIGLALAGLGNIGRGLWLEWSATSPKFNSSEASRKWDTFKPSSVGYQTVFYTAQQHGWVNPKSNAAQMVSSALPDTIEINLEEAGEVTIEYLINPYIPNQQAIGFYARGESGKSSMVATFCAEGSSEYSTLWITSEEAEAHIKKRHERLGGHPKTIGTINRPDFDIYTHLEGLIKQAKMKFSKPLGFVVLDSITALVTWGKGESANDEASVKRLVGLIDRLAQVEGVAILMIGHMNKSKGHEHIADTVSGSLAWTSSTRLSYILQKVPDQDFAGFIRTAKSNLGAHFGSFYHTVPVHQMAPNIDGFRAALCGVEFDGQRIYGEQNLRMAMAEDDDPMVKRMDEKREQIEKIVSVAVTLLKDGQRRTRADLEARFKFAKVKITRRLWLALDAELTARNVQISNGQHNMKYYQLCAVTPS